jgi:hypothetical protein
VAKVLVEVAVVTRKAGATGRWPKTDFSVVAFILDSLQEVLLVLVVQTIQTDVLNHRVYASAIQLYIHDVIHSNW